MMNLTRFRCATLAPRQAVVPVPDLAHFFDEGEPAEWMVRGLTGEEIARANEAAPRSRLVGAAIEALASTAAAKGDQVDALRSILGHGDNVPEDYAKAIDHLIFCSVNPVIDREIAVKVMTAYPVVAGTLSRKIWELTGLGPDLGK